MVFGVPEGAKVDDKDRQKQLGWDMSGIILIREFLLVYEHRTWTTSSASFIDVDG